MAEPVQRFGRYELLDQLGHGGFGVVYRARDPRLERDVALKTLLPHIAEDPAIRQRFLMEARAIARLHHPNIVTVYDADEVDGQPFYAMELIEGRSLPAVLDERHTLPLVEVLAIVRPLAAALDHLHAAGLIHRDLKPANIMLTPSGRVVLMDFGISRSLDGTHLTRSGSILGTPSYMAPEQVTGGDIAPAADLYALGTVAYELLAGNPPFAGPLAQVLYAHLHQPPPPLRECCPALPEHVYAAIEQALQKDPAARPHSAAAFVRMVDANAPKPAAVPDPAPARETLPVAGAGVSSLAGTLPADRAPDVPADGSAGNLPLALTSFVGRERELAEIERLLQDTRLLTLAGAGGCGKTRLALEVAGRLAGRFRDGVWLVDLTAVTDPALVVGVVAATLSAPDAAPIAGGATELAGRLRDRRLLMLLDNCEHLTSACAGLVGALLAACPGVVILATSREPLRVSGETTYRVTPLSLPRDGAGTSPDALLSTDAVRLFVARARAADPTFVLTDDSAAAVLQICRGLDGIPLALELAAARVPVLTVRQIAARLDDRLQLLTRPSRASTPHQQTLRAAIDWSYAVLDAQEQALLRRLSVFAGTFVLEDAEAVSNPERLDTYAFLDVLANLVDKSLVVADRHGDEAGYRLLETLRQYAGEKLRESGEEPAIRDAHQRWYCSLAERAEPELRGPNQAVWLARIESEHDNLRAVLDAAVTRPPDDDLGLRTAGVLTRFWEIRGYLSEGRRRLERILAVSLSTSLPVRARALHGAGVLAQRQGDGEQARALYEQALALRREQGDLSGTANTLNNLGVLARGEGDSARATELHEEAIRVRRACGDRLGEAMSLTNLGILARDCGDFSRAEALYGEAMQLYEGLGDRRGYAGALANVGEAANLAGDHRRAVQLISRALGVYLELGDKAGLAFGLEDLAMALAGCGDSMQAARLLGGAAALREEIGAPLVSVDRDELEQVVARLREDLGGHAYDAALVAGRMALPRELLDGVAEAAEASTLRV